MLRYKGEQNWQGCWSSWGLIPSIQKMWNLLSFSLLASMWTNFLKKSKCFLSLFKWGSPIWSSDSKKGGFKSRMRFAFFSNPYILQQFRVHIIVTLSYSVCEDSSLLYLLSDFIPYQWMIKVFILSSLFRLGVYVDNSIDTSILLCQYQSVTALLISLLSTFPLF